MLDSLAKNLSDLSGKSVRAEPSNVFPEPGQASSEIEFSNGTKLRINYWRLIKNGKTVLSSFDHQQKYGLPAPIDAIADLQRELESARCTEAQLDKETGDVILYFAGGLKLQTFNFTGYEIWEIIFPDGTGEYSNYMSLGQTS